MAEGVWDSLVSSSIADQSSAELQQQMESIPSRGSALLDLQTMT